MSHPDRLTEGVADEAVIRRAQFESIEGGSDKSAVVAGGISLSQELDVAFVPEDEIDERWALLNPSQKEVLSFVAQGLTDNEIAQTLGVTPNAVQVRVSLANLKLGVPRGSKRAVTKKYIQAYLYDQFTQKLDAQQKVVSSLTQSELVVLRSHAQGRTGEEIAQTLNTTPGSVHQHTYNLRKKLGRGDRNDKTHDLVTNFFVNGFKDESTQVAEWPMKLLEVSVQEAARVWESLTDLERKILEISPKITNIQIAGEEGVTETAIRRRRERAFRKIGVQDKGEAKRWLQLNIYGEDDPKLDKEDVGGIYFSPEVEETLILIAEWDSVNDIVESTGKTRETILRHITLIKDQLGAEDDFEVAILANDYLKQKNKRANENLSYEDDDKGRGAEENKGELTLEQKEILQDIAQGISITEIRANRSISSGTFSRRIDNIYRKLGVNNKAAAIIVAQERRIINVPSAPEVTDDAIRAITKAKLRVMKLLPRLLSNQEMAKDLGLSVSTIKNHISSLHGILGTNGNRAHLIMLARNIFEGNWKDRSDANSNVDEVTEDIAREETVEAESEVDSSQMGNGLEGEADPVQSVEVDSEDTYPPQELVGTEAGEVLAEDSVDPLSLLSPETAKSIGMLSVQELNILAIFAGYEAKNTNAIGQFSIGEMEVCLKDIASKLNIDGAEEVVEWAQHNMRDFFEQLVGEEENLLTRGDQQTVELAPELDDNFEWTTLDAALQPPENEGTEPVPDGEGEAQGFTEDVVSALDESNIGVQAPEDDDAENPVEDDPEEEKGPATPADFVEDSKGAEEDILDALTAPLEIDNESTDWPSFTLGEERILPLLVAELSNAGIAERLRATTGGVQVSVSKIRKKLGGNSREDTIRLARTYLTNKPQNSVTDTGGSEESEHPRPESRGPKRAVRRARPPEDRAPSSGLEIEGSGEDPWTEIENLEPISGPRIEKAPTSAQERADIKVSVPPEGFMGINQPNVFARSLDIMQEPTRERLVPKKSTARDKRLGEDTVTETGEAFREMAVGTDERARLLRDSVRMLIKPFIAAPANLEALNADADGLVEPVMPVSPTVRAMLEHKGALRDGEQLRLSEAFFAALTRSKNRRIQEIVNDRTRVNLTIKLLKLATNMALQNAYVELIEKRQRDSEE